jgi:hypothetical protein
MVPATLPELPPEHRQDKLSKAPSNTRTAQDDGQRSWPQRLLIEKVIAELEGVPAGGRNAALNHAAWTLRRWIVVGALEQADVEDALYVPALNNALTRDDGARPDLGTIRGGLNKGLLVLIDVGTGGSTAIPEGPRQGDNVIDPDRRSVALPRLKAASGAATCCAAGWR